MIALGGVAARRAPLTLASVSLEWGPGVHSVIGAPGDGAALLLALLGGSAQPRAGQIRVLGGPPTDAAVRTQVSRIPLEVTLPDALRVREALDVAAEIRGEPARDAAERLAALGVETLADRAVRSLSRSEARAVTLIEGLTSSCVRVLLLEEPLVAMDPRAAGRIPEALRSAARNGRAVVVATASVRDAGELADDHVLLRGGAIVGRATSIEALAGLSPEGARLCVVARDDRGARALAARLAGEPDVEVVERNGKSMRVRGSAPTTLARAVGRAVVEADVEVSELRVDEGAP
jgi:ABC-2 type transport system ATP-binding protein